MYGHLEFKIDVLVLNFLKSILQLYLNIVSCHIGDKKYE